MSIANRVIASVIFLTGLFVTLAIFVPTEPLIITFNGLFAGSVLAVVTTYFRTLADSLLGIRPYDRVRQFAISTFLIYAAYIMSSGVSIYLRSSGVDVTSNVLTAAHRYVAIISAIGTVMSPDFGQDLLYGKSRKALIFGLVAGTAASAFVILAQTFQIFADDSIPAFLRSAAERYPDLIALL